MVFSSPIFLFVFLPLVLLVHALSPWRVRNAVLLLASLFFYSWGEGVFVAIMLGSILANWGFGLCLDRETGPRRRRAIVALAVIVNIGLLCVFKYAALAAHTLNGALGLLGLPPGPVPQILLPLGISFFTFHSLSYVIDIYRRVARAQRSLPTFALYISFFPQLVAGPIIRYHDIEDQLGRRRLRADQFASGIERFVTGLAKKVLLANPFGQVADVIFALPASQLNGGLAWIGLAAYTLQIYLDFSAYSDMAIGLGRMFGFEFLENFNYPYIARSVQEFWRRWHISLSNWFRDYLYIPLGGNRVAPWRTYANLVTVFLLCGLWHGASWNFAIWGLLHGAFLVIERLGLGRLLEHAPGILRHIYVMAVVMAGWVFFRADTLDGALAIFRALAGANGWWADEPHWQALIPNQAIVLAPLGLLAATPLFAIVTRDWRARLAQRMGETELTLREPVQAGRELALSWLRIPVLAVMLVLAMSWLAAGTYNPFIYFRF